MLLVDLKGEEIELEEDDIQLRKEGACELWDGLRKMEGLWRQKSRAMWMRLEDTTTRFFHRYARRSRNAMQGLWKDGSWMEDLARVKMIVAEHFKKQFSEVKWRRPIVEDVEFKKISTKKNLRMEAEFSLEEVKKAVEECNSEKASRPDGFNFKFIKFAWDILEEDIMQFVKDFHANGKLNGRPTDEFRMERGLCQGNPLFPFLFLLIARGLHCLIHRAVDEGLLEGISMGKGNLQISHLQFVDDTVIMAKAKMDYIWIVKEGGVGASNVRRRRLSKIWEDNVTSGNEGSEIRDSRKCFCLGVGSGNNICERCKEDAKDVTHIMLSCKLAYQMFKKYGHVHEIYCPEKRDKFNRRFGLVRFQEAENAAALGRMLEYILFEEQKPHTNIPRFDKKKKGHQDKPARRDIIFGNVNR
ncbi:hypothetical protein SLEP1_g37741 [Rubroshorea leprosula]|uniref:RRM domain-containing protein n=1 Tax=Rubroshorea leprosula TaxID=152421 RepID=A0AAV5KVT8_9ROSI|nr:hypothetical protein SLEP1_g37741 [Rubroshorea leprosula]